MDSLKSVTQTLMPNSETWAYALFLATNATSIWGGVFPFLPLDFQTQNLMFWFFCAQATCFSLTFLVSAYIAYNHPAATRRPGIIMACIPYFIGWCFLISAIYIHGHELPLAIAGGLFLGVGSAAFYMLWQRLFVLQGADYGMRNLIVGTAFAAILYAGLYFLPKAVTAYLIPLVFLPLMALSISLSMRKIPANRIALFDTPREHPRVYVRVWRIFWRSALCMGSLGFCSGIMRAIAIHQPAVGDSVNLLSMVALFIAAMGLLFLWQVKDVRIDVMGMYRLLFPIIVTALMLIAFMPIGYHRWLAAGFYALYSIAILLLMIQAGQASRDFGVNPIYLFGLMGGVIFFMHDGGFILGSLVNSINAHPAFNTTAVALVAVWVLATIYFVTSGKLSDALTSAFQDSSIELIRCPVMQNIDDLSFEGLIDEHAPEPNPVMVEQPSQESVPLNTTEQKTSTTDMNEQFKKLQKLYGLSTRELEVAQHLVRGKTVARIAEDLYVSENTIRTHSKRIYAKLNIHKKIELVDLLESL